MNSQDLRKCFIDFFIQKSHHFIKASPLFNPNDPSLLFTNAGMNQFKDILLEKEKAINSRLTNSQPCIRVSGKHNDLEEVGIDHYHHTLFEMLGNWSFGNYGKKEAIKWAWEWITEVLKLPTEKLYATYFHEDLESRDIWLKETTIKPEHVLAFGEKDNFWEMGSTGPCGPCSEIHFDKGPSACDRNNDPIQGSCVNGGSGRFVELWNLVFIQYNREKDHSLSPLKQLSVDTGAGLERLAAILQNKDSNYDTDLFQPIIQAIAKKSNYPYRSDETGIPHRVLADHTRALCFAIADGILPSNESRGYVLRRLIRRASRYASQLGFEEPILYDLVSILCDQYKEFYPHLEEQEKNIKQILLKEEKQFLVTLQTGLKQFQKIAEKGSDISGAEAFKLYDTFGFPIDLTQLIAKEKKLKVDTTGFQAALAEQKKRSRQKKESNEDESELKFDIPEDFKQHNQVHLSVYTYQAGGGEAKIPENEYERFLLAQNHSAVHLLLFHLRKQLGNHISQAGSMVHLNRFRFDFTHNETILSDQIDALEKGIQKSIEENIPIQIINTRLNDAKKMGAIATFGEKYGDDVRVVKIGEDCIELCGGNHVLSTSLIESVKLTRCKSVAAGVKRIEGIASKRFVTDFENQSKQEMILQIQKKLAKNNIEIKEDLDQYSLCKLKKMEKEIKSNTKVKQSITVDNNLLQDIKEQHLKVFSENKKIYSKILYDISLQSLRKLADELATEQKSLVILGLVEEEKGTWLVKNNDFKDAKSVLESLTLISEGKGGGKNNFAQAGNAKAALMEKALKQILEELQDE